MRRSWDTDDDSVSMDVMMRLPTGARFFTDGSFDVPPRSNRSAISALSRIHTFVPIGHMGVRAARVIVTDRASPSPSFQSLRSGVRSNAPRFSK